MLHAPPRLGPGWIAAAATHHAAARRDPAPGLVTRGGRGRRRRTRLAGTRPCRPVRACPASPPRHRGDRSRPHEGRQHPPGQDAVERPAARPAVAGGPRARVAATATGQQPRPPLQAPAPGVPRDACAGVVSRTPRTRGHPPPRQGLDVPWRLACTDLHGPTGHAGQALSRAGPGRATRHRTPAPGQCGVTAGRRATTGRRHEAGFPTRVPPTRGPPPRGPTPPAPGARPLQDAPPPAGQRPWLHGRPR
jgi:hypothetical protein